MSFLCWPAMVGFIKMTPNQSYTKPPGIWDCLNSQHVVDFVRREVAQKKLLGQVCENIMEHCFAPDTQDIGQDNMTILIVAILNGRTEEEWYAMIRDRVAHKLGYNTPDTPPQIYSDARLTFRRAQRSDNKLREPSKLRVTHDPLELMHEPAEGLDQYDPMDEDGGSRPTTSTSTQESQESQKSSPPPESPHTPSNPPPRAPRQLGGLAKVLNALGLAAVLCYGAWLLA